MGPPLLFLLFVLKFLAGANTAYTEETPVKLLKVDSMADRYPAAESEYRISITNGQVIDDFNADHD